MRYSNRRRARSPLLVMLVAFGALAAACGGSSSGKTAQVSTQSTTQAQSSAASGSPVKLMTHKGPLGTYLTDDKGRALYLFAADTGSSSTCSGQCATYWPPLMGASATAASGASASLIGTTSRQDGSTQITYAGHPLYLYAGDTKAGDTKGQGSDNFGAKWWLVDPQGKPITAAASSPSSGSSSSSGGSGWG